MSEKTPPFENTVKTALSGNTGLNFLFRFKSQLVGASVVFGLFYLAMGFVIAVLSHSLDVFLLPRDMTVRITLLSTIVVSAITATWYSSILVNVFAATPDVFEVEQEKVIKVIQKWLYSIRFPKLLIAGLVIAVIGVTVSRSREILYWQQQGFPPPGNWLTIYFQILNTIYCFILGFSITALFYSISLLYTLFQFDLKLFQFRLLRPLGSLSIGLSVASLVFVGLFVLLVFDQVDYLTVTTVAVGIILAVSIVFVSQFFYKNAITRAKDKYFCQLGILYEQHYGILSKKAANLQSLKNAQDSLESLVVFEKKLDAIPLWFFNVSDTLRVIFSLLPPVGSLVITEIISRIP